MVHFAHFPMKANEMIILKENYKSKFFCKIFQNGKIERWEFVWKLVGLLVETRIRMVDYKNYYQMLEILLKISKK